MRKLFALATLLLALPLAANDTSVHTLQSGSPTGPTPLHDHGLHGEGEIVAVLDTGLDWDNCYFAEDDNSPPPINSGTPGGGLQSSNVDLRRRKVVAYDFLYACSQYPGAPGCDNPADPLAFDNQGHGTHAAGSAVGDQMTPIVHDPSDAIATGAKLIVQDAGYIGGDACSQRPGLGCPISNLTNALQQAYQQGARIHSNSWGDRQGVAPPAVPPTANYSTAAREVDAFVFAHPDMLVVFNTGNAGPGVSTLSSPGVAKNTLDVGGTRYGGVYGDDTITAFSGQGPARDGRLKPDIVAPAYVVAADSDLDVRTRNCDANLEGGTSWSSPTIAGAATLVRQYFRAGFYPTGAARAADAFTPSAALLKAVFIAAARSVPQMHDGRKLVAIAPAPSPIQGWGFPVLGNVLRFVGDSRSLRVVDTSTSNGLAANESRSLRIRVPAGAAVRAVLVWTDPPGTAVNGTSTTPQLVNDLDLVVSRVGGSGSSYGNEALHPGVPDRLNNVEVVDFHGPVAATWDVAVAARTLRSGSRQSYALLLSGDFSMVVPRLRSVRR